MLLTNTLSQQTNRLGFQAPVKMAVGYSSSKTGFQPALARSTPNVQFSGVFKNIGQALYKFFFGWTAWLNQKADASLDKNAIAVYEAKIQEIRSQASKAEEGIHKLVAHEKMIESKLKAAQANLQALNHKAEAAVKLYQDQPDENLATNDTEKNRIIQTKAALKKRAVDADTASKNAILEVKVLEQSLTQSKQAAEKQRIRVKEMKTQVEKAVGALENAKQTKRMEELLQQQVELKKFMDSVTGQTFAQDDVAAQIMERTERRRLELESQLSGTESPEEVSVTVEVDKMLADQTADKAFEDLLNRVNGGTQANTATQAQGNPSANSGSGDVLSHVDPNAP